MNLVSISCGGFADWGFGSLRDLKVPLNVIFGVFASVALLSRDPRTADNDRGRICSNKECASSLSYA